MSSLTVRELVTKWGFDVDDKKVRSFNKDIEDTKKRLDKLSTKLTHVGKAMTLFLFLPAVGLGTMFVKSASDAEETIAKFGTVFDRLTKQSNETALNLARDFGLSSVKAKELLGNTGDLLTGFGFSQKSALNLSKQVNELAVDLASFTNFSGGAEGASSALTKALLGERESVKSLGISILEEDVKRRVALNTSKGMRFETKRQAKAFATLELAQTQSKIAIGDFSRTSTSFANRSRIFRARIQDLAESFGNLLLPAATKTLNAVIKLTNKINGLSDGTKKVILVISGITAIVGPLILVLGVFIKSLSMVITTYRALTAVVLAYKNAQFLANAQALLLPGLIAGGIVLVIALIEDLIRFFRGDNSVVGIIIDGFKHVFGFLESEFNRLPGFFKTIVGAIMGVILTPIQLIMGIIDRFKKMVRFVKGDSSIKNLANTLGKNMLDIMPVIRPIMSGMDISKDGFSGALGFNGRPPTPQYKNTSTNIVEVKAPITVQVPEGTSASEVGFRVERGVNNAIKDLLRTTLRANEPQVAF